MERWKDSFDFYATAQGSLLYSTFGGVISAGIGRRGTDALQLYNTTAQKSLDNQATWIVGVAAKFGALPSADGVFLAFYDSVTTQCDLRLTSTGELRVTCNGTSLGVTTGLGLLTNVWYHIGFKAVIDNTTGAFEVWVNNVSKLSGSGVDTQNSANAYANKIYLTSSGMTINFYFDDLYILDGQAGLNSFLGDLKVTARLPDGAGDRTEWTPSVGVNYQNVDDATPDSDTTYNSSGTAGQADLYSLAGIVGSPTIKSVSILAFVRKDDAGSRIVEIRIKTNAVEYGGADVSVGDSYQYISDNYENNPQTTVAWTPTEVNALQAGVNLIS